MHEHRVAQICRPVSLQVERLGKYQTLEKELARRFNLDRSAISLATKMVIHDPELPAATKTMQKGLEIAKNQH